MFRCTCGHLREQHEYHRMTWYCNECDCQRAFTLENSGQERYRIELVVGDYKFVIDNRTGAVVAISSGDTMALMDLVAAANRDTKEL